MSRLIAGYQQFWSYTILRIIYKPQAQTPLTNHKTRCLAIHISGPHTDERLWRCDTALTLWRSFSNTRILQQDCMLSHSQNRRGGVRGLNNLVPAAWTHRQLSQEFYSCCISSNSCLMKVMPAAQIQSETFHAWYVILAWKILCPVSYTHLTLPTMAVV